MSAQDLTSKFALARNGQAGAAPLPDLSPALLPTSALVPAPARSSYSSNSSRPSGPSRLEIIQARADANYNRLEAEIQLGMDQLDRLTQQSPHLAQLPNSPEGVEAAANLRLTIIKARQSYLTTGLKLAALYGAEAAALRDDRTKRRLGKASIRSREKIAGAGASTGVGDPNGAARINGLMLAGAAAGAVAGGAMGAAAGVGIVAGMIESAGRRGDKTRHLLPTQEPQEIDGCISVPQLPAGVARG